MSYADLALQRKQLMDAAFRKRYNPLEDTFAELAKIEEDTKRSQRDDEEYARKKKEAEAESVRAEERLKIEKSRAQEESALRNLKAEETRIGLINMPGEQALKRYQSEALVKQREAQAAADAARQRVGEEKAARDAENAAREASLATGKARIAGMRAQGMGYEDIRNSASGDPALDRLDDSDVQSILSQLEAIDAETARKKGESDALIAQRNAAAALSARKGFPKPEKPKTPEQLADEAQKRLYNVLKNKRLARSLAEGGGFVPVESEIRDMQKARRLISSAKAETNVLRQLMAEYPDFASYTGPVDGLIVKIKAKFGAGSKEASKIKAAIDRVFQAYKVATTGAAAGVVEMEDLKGIMPKIGDNFETIMGKLDAADAMSQTIVDQLDLVLGKMDIRAADELTSGIPASKQQPSASASSSAPSVDVQAAADEAGVELE